MSTISSVTIVYNEEKWVGSHIDHLKPYVDEIVLVDGGSKDKTVEIAKEKGVDIKINPQPEDLSQFSFGTHWSYAMDLVKSDWIFILGVDERPNQALLTDLHDIIDSVDPLVEAFTVGVNHYLDGVFRKDINPELHTRIVRNKPYIRYTRGQFLHESLDNHIRGRILLLNDKYSVAHDKPMTRQQQQNKFYRELSEKWKLRK